MTTLKHNIDHIISGTPPGMTRVEYNDFNKALNASIDSKLDSGAIKFADLNAKDIELSQLSDSIDLSRFGLQGPDDLRKFLLTPAGETVKHTIATEIALEKANEEERQIQYQEQLLREAEIKSLLFHALLSEKAEAKQAQDELVQMQNEELAKERQSVQEAPPPEENDKSGDILKGYEDAIRKHQHQHQRLATEEKALQAELESLQNEGKEIAKKHDAFKLSSEEFDKKNYDDYSEEDLKKELDSFENDIKAETEKASAALEQGDEDKAQAHKDRIYTKRLDMERMKHIIENKAGNNTFVDAEGNSKGVKEKDAAFVIPKGHQLVKQNGEHYLLKAGQKWDDVVKNPDKMKAANLRFENAKPQIMSVKHTMQHVEKQEKALNEAKIEATRTHIATNKAEQTLCKNNEASMHAARANFQAKMLKPNPGVNMKSPDSTITSGLSSNSMPLMHSPALSQGSAKMSNGPQPITAGAFVKTELNSLSKQNGTGYQPTWKDLSNIVDKIPNSPEKDAADKMVKSAEKAAKKMKPEEMLKFPPVPPQVMAHLLQNMARLELNPYDPSVSTQQAPGETTVKESYKSPTPFDMHGG